MSPVLPPNSIHRITDRKGEVATCMVMRPLATGANAATYLARREDGLPIVLKAAQRRTKATHDLVIEERILKGLRHANVVRYLGKAVDDEQLILASERLFPNPMLVLNAPAIRAHFPDDLGNHYYYPLPPSVGLALSTDLLRGLEYLHRHGFVHHDVKLGNLLVRLDVTPPASELDQADQLDLVIGGKATGVLVDFGATRSTAYLDDLAAGKVDPKIVPPQITPVYAPPESLHVDPRQRRNHASLDLYAAAILIYTCLSGRLPYDHLQLDPTDLKQLIEAKQEERRGKLLPISYEALSGVRGIQAIVADLYGFLSACLHRRPEERPTPREARTFVEGLHRLLTKGKTGRFKKPQRHADGAIDPNQIMFGTTSKERRQNRDQARGRTDR